MPPAKNTPLFDLLSRGQSSSPGAMRAVTREAKPVVRVELKPRVVVGAAGERGGTASGSGVAGMPSVSSGVERGREGKWGLSQNAVYMGVAAAAIVVILTYIVGFKVGTSKEAARAEKELGAAFGDRPSVVETDGAGNGRVLRGQETPVRESAGQPEAPRLAPRQGAGSGVVNGGAVVQGGQVLISAGVGADPRESGPNYFALAVLPRGDAEAAIRFLGENGLEAIGVPVDAGQREGNNPGSAGRFRVYALPGFAGDQLSSSAAQSLQAKVAKLGGIWQREHRGASDFRRPQWIKKK